MYARKIISNKCFEFCLRKMAIVSEDIIVTGSYFKIVGAARENARLSILVLGTKRKLFGN